MLMSRPSLLSLLATQAGVTRISWQSRWLTGGVQEEACLLVTSMAHLPPGPHQPTNLPNRLPQKILPPAFRCKTRQATNRLTCKDFNHVQTVMLQVFQQQHFRNENKNFNSVEKNLDFFDFQNLIFCICIGYSLSFKSHRDSKLGLNQTIE